MRWAGFTLLEVALAMAVLGVGATAAVALQAHAARVIRRAASIEAATEIGRQTIHRFRTSGLGGSGGTCLDPWFGVDAVAQPCVVTVVPCELTAGTLRCTTAAPFGGLQLVTVTVQASDGAPQVYTTLVRHRP